MLRKTIKNIALLDLQNFTAGALREIKKIESCAMLLIPKNASDEWKNAYAKITIRNVASIIEVSYSKYSVLNGMVVLNDKNVSDDCLYIVNGIVILETVEKIPDLCVNGLLLKRKKSRYEMTRMNGRSVEVEDNVVIKPYPNTIEIDGDTVRSFDYNTLVAAGNNVDIVDDVTEQMLSDKKITFAAVNEVKCGKNILGYVKVNSTVGNKITEKMNNIELFNQIYEKYYKSIVSYFSRRFDSDEAEDLAQITFMKLWGYLPTLGYIKKEKSLIFKIAKNVLADRLRKNNFADSLDELESIKCLEVFDDITSVEIQQILLKMSELTEK